MATLRRELSFIQLVGGGVGTMVGAGIYSTLSQIVGVTGNAAWAAYFVSMIVASFSALSFAELASRFPSNGGSSRAVHEATGRGGELSDFLSNMTGLVTASFYLTALGATCDAFAGISLDLLGLAGTVPVWPVTALFLVALAALNIKGVKETNWVLNACTVIELGGLVLVILFGLRYWGSVNLLEVPTPAPTSVTDDAEGTATTSLGVASAILRIVHGAYIAFFTFGGFESISNSTEEAVNAKSSVPRALLYACVLTGGLYMAVAITVVSVIPASQVATLSFPMATIMREACPWLPMWVMAVIGMCSTFNTALGIFQTVSRLFAGMASMGVLNRRLADVNRTYRTPHNAILAVLGVSIGLTAMFSPGSLVMSTSFLLLISYTASNASLVVIKRRDATAAADAALKARKDGDAEPDQSATGAGAGSPADADACGAAAAPAATAVVGEDPRQYHVPIAVPVLGCVVCTLLFLAAAVEQPLNFGLTVVLLGSMMISYPFLRGQARLD